MSIAINNTNYYLRHNDYESLNKQAQSEALRQKVFDTDYCCNTDGWMNGAQVYGMDSLENMQLYKQLFLNAIEQGLDPNDNALKIEIQSRGTLDFDQLLPEHQTELIAAVEAAYAAYNNLY